MSGMSNRAIKILAGFVLSLPILALLHELLIIIVAVLISSLANGDFLYQSVKQFLASPVHARIMVETLGGVQPQGIAVAGIPGKFLHGIAPSLFVDPNTLALTGWVSAIVNKNSTVLGFYATQALVEFIVIIAGALLLQSGLRKRTAHELWSDGSLNDIWRVLVGLFVIAQAVWAAFDLTMSPALAGLRETGLGVGFSLLFQVNQQQYNWLMDQALPVLIPLLLTGLAIGVAWVIGKLIYHARVWYGIQTPVNQRSIRMRAMRKIALACALVLLMGLSPITQRYFGIAQTSLIAPTSLPAQKLAQVPTPMPTVIIVQNTATPTSTLTVTPTALSISIATPTIQPTLAPSPTPTAIKQRIVELVRRDKKFVLIVNGRPTYLHGLNYNVNYTLQPDNIKRQYQQRDFALMRQAGVNAVIGWGVYDHVTLDIAREHNIGVIMPFELDAKGNYENKNFREHIKDDFRKYVLTYKDAPAVWGWNPGGDELLHRMETEQHRTPDKLQAASDFLLELSALAYTLDPNRISIIKEPRDWYVPYVEESVRRVRLQKPAIDPSKYFVFAVNTYGKPEGVALVLNTTRASVEDRIGIAFAVGEFAPFGLARSERPAHYAAMWNTVRETSSLGGFAYVYGPDQPNPNAPNPYDPLRLLVSEFSLVDNEGKPIDGSFEALSNQWRQSEVSVSKFGNGVE